MRGDLATTLAEFWERNDQWIGALLTLIGWILLAFAFDRWFTARGRKLADKVLRGGLSQEVDTRLRFIRRLVWLTIIVIGVLSTVGQFTGLDKLATSLLASGALAAAIVGFAARQTLANLVAGIMLALTQPLRVGDWVTFEGHYGVVEDVRLNYTILRTASEQRIVIPNEKLAGGVMKNDTLVVEVVGLDVAIWLPPEADAERAITALVEETGQEVTVAEAVPWGVRLAVGSDPVAPPERAAAEAALRRQCLRRLRDEGLLARDSN